MCNLKFSVFVLKPLLSRSDTSSISVTHKVSIFFFVFDQFLEVLQQGGGESDRDKKKKMRETSKKSKGTQELRNKIKSPHFLF